MRIAQVSPYDVSFFGGVVAHMVDLSHSLVERGHDVTMFAPCARQQPAPDMGDLDLVRLGGSVPFVTGDSVSRISLSIRALRHLRRVLFEEKFDIVHVQEPLMPFLGTFASAYSPSTTVGTFHAYNEGVSPGYIFWRPILKVAADRLHGRIAVSEAASDYASRYFPGDYTVIPNGCNTAKFAKPLPRPDTLRADSINVLFMGRLGEKRKGLQHLLGAYSTLKWRHPNLRLVVVGPGPPDMASYRLMGERGLDDVVFTGPVSDAEQPAYYQHADVFCAPNTGKESFGLVLVEAMASGTAVVASDIPGFAGVATHERDALLVEPKNESALAHAIGRLIDDPAMRQRLATRGRATAVRYRWGSVTDRVVEYYQEVIARSHVQVTAPPSYAGG